MNLNSNSTGKGKSCQIKQMHPYLQDIQHAASSLIDAIFYEEAELKVLGTELQSLRATLDDLATRVDFLQRNPDLDDEGLATCMYWEARFDVAPKADDVATRIQNIQHAIENRRASAQALATGLLQVAKQGMSVANGGLEKSGKGRAIGQQMLRGVIWQGRNQAMHYEEETLNAWVVKCFELLSADFGDVFKAFQDRCLAYEVVQLLGWSDIKQFNDDLNSVLCPA